MEQFLATTHMKIAYGRSRDCDNLVRATVFMVDLGLTDYFSCRAEGLAESQHGSIGRLACVVSRTLAVLILQPEAWRIPALLGTTQLLTPWIGLNAAAGASASSTHEFTVSLTKYAARPMDVEIAEFVSDAIKHPDAASLIALGSRIAAWLSSQPCSLPATTSLVLPRAITGPWQGSLADPP